MDIPSPLWIGAILEVYPLLPNRLQVLGTSLLSTSAAEKHQADPRVTTASGAYPLSKSDFEKKNCFKAWLYLPIFSLTRSFSLIFF